MCREVAALQTQYMLHIFRKPTVKILAMADLHGVPDAYEWLVATARARTPDVVILAGDLLGGSLERPTIRESHASEAEIIAALLGSIECPVLYIMGNDDMVDLPPRPGHLIPLHGRRWKWGSVNFVGYQYSLPFMGGIFEKPEAEIKEDLKRLAKLVNKKTVLVTHSPAYGILDMGLLGRNVGSQSILDLINKRHPLAHIHGHVHQATGREGTSWNVAASGHRRAVMIDLATLEDEVITDLNKRL